MAIDIMVSFERDPPQLDFIWPGFLSGTVGALIAPGATGKSFWALEASMSVAGGISGGDLLDLNPFHSGRVFYLAGEDPEAVLVRRIHAIGKHLDLSARQAIAENLIVEPIMGSLFNIMDERHLERLIEFSTVTWHGLFQHWSMLRLEPVRLFFICITSTREVCEMVFLINSKRPVVPQL